MNWSFDQYRERLPELIREAPRNTSYPATIFATFSLAIEKATQQTPDAEVLMGIFAYLAPDAIELSIVSRSIMAESQRGTAIAALEALSLLVPVTFDDGAAGVSVHRLVQQVMRERLAATGKDKETADLAFQLVGEAPLHDTNDSQILRHIEHLTATLGAHADIFHKEAEKLEGELDEAFEEADQAVAQQYLDALALSCEVGEFTAVVTMLREGLQYLEPRYQVTVVKWIVDADNKQWSDRVLKEIRDIIPAEVLEALNMPRTEKKRRWWQR